jgi:hypothetical protein
LLHLKLTYKKKPCTPRSRKGPMSKPPVSPGARCRKALIQKSSCSSTRPGPRPT